MMRSGTSTSRGRSPHCGRDWNRGCWELCSSWTRFVRVPIVRGSTPPDNAGSSWCPVSRETLSWLIGCVTDASTDMDAIDVGCTSTRGVMDGRPTLMWPTLRPVDPSTVVRACANRSAEPVVCSAGNPIQLGRNSSPSHGRDDVDIDASGSRRPRCRRRRSGERVERFGRWSVRQQFHVKHGVPTRAACEG